MKKSCVYPRACPRRDWGILALLALLSAGDVFAQSTNSLAVEIFGPQDGATFQAPANIDLVASVDIQGPVPNGASVSVEFFAKARSLGKKTTSWHGERRPPVRAGMATPFIIVAEGFDAVAVVWSNAPAGKYALTAKATFAKGVRVVSKPVNITVLP